MNANEAREAALKAAADDIKAAEMAIIEAAGKGQLSVALFNLKPATTLWLRDNGYKFEVETSSMQDVFTVSWRTSK